MTEDQLHCMSFDIFLCQPSVKCHSSAQAQKRGLLLLLTCIATAVEKRCTDCTLELLQDHRVLAAPLYVCWNVSHCGCYVLTLSPCP